VGSLNHRKVILAETTATYRGTYFTPMKLSGASVHIIAKKRWYNGADARGNATEGDGPAALEREGSLPRKIPSSRRKQFIRGAIASAGNSSDCRVRCPGDGRGEFRRGRSFTLERGAYSHVRRSKSPDHSPRGKGGTISSGRMACTMSRFFGELIGGADGGEKLSNTRDNPPQHPFIKKRGELMTVDV